MGNSFIGSQTGRKLWFLANHNIERSSKSSMKRSSKTLAFGSA